MTVAELILALESFDQDAQVAMGGDPPRAIGTAIESEIPGLVWLA